MSVEPVDPIDYDLTDPEILAMPPAERERFTITDDQQATWAMRKLMSLRKRQAEIDALARVEIERIESWHLHASGGLIADTNYFTGVLVEYARAERETNDRKSISLPYGMVKSRAGSRHVEVSDVAAFTQWAQANSPTLLRVRVEPDKAAIKASLKDEGTAGVIDTTTGEIVPGVTIVQSQTTYTVETN